MRLFIGFILLFVIFGMSTRSLGAWGYLIIVGAASVMAGLYMFTGAVW